MSIICPPIMPLLPGRFCEAGHETAANFGRRMCLPVRENLERNRQKRVASEHRRRLVERDMCRRPTAPEIVVVHAGQVVVHERIGVQHLDGRGHAQRMGRLDTEQPRGFEDQERPEALSAGKGGIAHRFMHPRVQPVRIGQDLLQCGLDSLRPIRPWPHPNDRLGSRD